MGERIGAGLTCSNDRYCAAWMHVASDGADFETGGESVAHDEKASFVDVWGDVVEACICVWHAEIFGVSAVNEVAELPAAMFA